MHLVPQPTFVSPFHLHLHSEVLIPVLLIFSLIRSFFRLRFLPKVICSFFFPPHSKIEYSLSMFPFPTFSTNSPYQMSSLPLKGLSLRPQFYNVTHQISWQSTNHDPIHGLQGSSSQPYLLLSAQRKGREGGRRKGAETWTVLTSEAYQFYVLSYRIQTSTSIFCTDFIQASSLLS